MGSSAKRNTVISDERNFRSLRASFPISLLGIEKC